jgi:hypothetical protein
MDDKLFLLVMRVFGNRLYELQVGFATMFNLSLDRGVFSEALFHQERERLENLPEFQKFRADLDALNRPMEEAEIERLLREYEGPIQ